MEINGNVVNLIAAVQKKTEPMVNKFGMGDEVGVT